MIKGKSGISYTLLKISCTWIFNKLTFGLSPASASQKIDILFEKATDKTFDRLKKNQISFESEIKQQDKIVGDHTKKLSEKRGEIPSKKQSPPKITGNIRL